MKCCLLVRGEMVVMRMVVYIESSHLQQEIALYIHFSTLTTHMVAPVS